jgi:DNA-binding NtrC family response regulator
MKTKTFLKRLFSGEEETDPGCTSILIVDDDEGLCDNLKDILEVEGYETVSANTAARGLELAAKMKPCLALVDLKLPDRKGTALLAELKQLNPECTCILMTAYADVDSAVQALEKGAFYYLQKPIRPAELVELVELAFETIRLRDEKRQAEEALKTRNKELEEIIERLRKIIDHNQPT